MNQLLNASISWWDGPGFLAFALLGIGISTGIGVIAERKVAREHAALLDDDALSHMHDIRFRLSTAERLAVEREYDRRFRAHDGESPPP